MDRCSWRYGYLAAAVMIVLAGLSAAGCSGLRGLGYLIKGNDVDADFPGLKEKKVVVVCRPLVSLQYRNAGAARELAQQIGSYLEANVPKIKVVDQQEVGAWMDENSWEEFSEVGKAMKADMVVGVDLTSFSVLNGQTLYQGRANVSFKVYDCEKKKVVYEKTLPQCVYPPNISMPADKPENDFRSEFIRVVASQISRHFYVHDEHADIGLDGGLH